jgi:hypothetical protein
MPSFLLTVFLSAFLLFQIQPIIARYILPAYGGSPAVWTSCMMFFQLGLLLGYFYAHVLATRVKPKQQVILHLSLLVLSLVLMPIGVPDAWQPDVSAAPTTEIFALLAISVGIPFALISASGPLLQHWFAGAYQGKSPFRLYAVSNLGSLVALLSYPVLFEPLFTIDAQATVWSAGYLALLPFCLLCGIAYTRNRLNYSAIEATADELRPVKVTDRILWVALAACGSTLLLATTNQISQDIAVVPFLWILPLSIYLITFIICFDSDSWYRRDIWLIMLAISLTLLLRLMFLEFSDEWKSVSYQISTYCLALFSCCMICHGELARNRSSVRHLTTFYLYVALGGALGGIFVNLIAPVLFTGYWELHISITATVILAGVCIGRDKKTFRTPRNRTIFSSASSILVAALIAVLVFQVRDSRDNSIFVDRSFFGVLYVDESNTELPEHSRGLYHGSIQHGIQYMHPSFEHLATSYYGMNSGAGIALRKHPNRLTNNLLERGLHIGIVGLGVGTLSTHGTRQDKIRYYEINHQVEYIAYEYFNYLKNGKAYTEIILGDARVSMQRELLESGSNKFDVLILDAFSGDSVPVHLLTQEAFDLYAQHMNPDGIIAIHITNQHLDLTPVILAAANRLGMEAAWVEGGDKRWYENTNDWMLISANQEFMAAKQLNSLKSDLNEQQDPILWTDDFSNLFQIIEWD